MRVRSLAAAMAVTALTAAAIPAAAPAKSIAIKGSHFVNGAGRTIRLVGVNRSGTEYACTGPLDGQSGGPYGYGIFQGPTSAQSIRALLTWRINAVALPLNEACWLGGYGDLNPNYSGAHYRSAITAYVKALHARGIYVVLRLSGAAPGDRAFGSVLDESTDEVPMADADHSIAFWTSLAAAFAKDRMVVFHAFDEPHDISWRCILTGCTVTDAPGGKARYGDYTSAGHQAIIDAIRGAGARQPVILSGPDFAGDVSQWRANMPNDPEHQLAADVSSFDYADSVLRAESTLRTLAGHVPIVIGGFGDTDCNSDYSRKVMAVADRLGMSELAWTWNTVQDYGGCSNALLDGGAGSSATAAYSTGRASGFGRGVRARYRQLDAHRRW